MNEKWLSVLFRSIIAILLISILVAGWLVVRVALQKPTVPRTAAERAIMDGEAAVKADPRSVNARLSLAAAYAGTGRYGDAAKILNIAIKLAPKNVKAHYMLGVVYKDQGQLDKAIASFKKAAGLEGELGDIYNDIYFELGKTYEQKGDYKSAIDAFLKAEDYGVPLYLLRELAMAYEKTGAVEDAKIAYLNILERDVENADALKALKRLGVSKQIIEEVQRSGRSR